MDDNSQPSFKREMLAALPSLRAFAISLIGRHDRADDLVQDTIMKAWAKQDHYQMGTNMKAWLFTILRNELFSQMRKHGREVQDSDGVFTESMATHPSQYGSMDLQDFRRALEKLGIPSTTFHRWYDRFLTGGVNAPEDRKSRPGRVWNRIPEIVRERVIELTLRPCRPALPLVRRPAQTTSRWMRSLMK